MVTIWVWGVVSALMLLGTFYILKSLDFIDDMPGKPLPIIGIKWEHAWGALLFLIPPFDWYIYIIWAFGYWCYMDDLYQHLRRMTEPNYTSPLHKFGWWYLRPFLLRIWRLMGQ